MSKPVLERPQAALDIEAIADFLLSEYPPAASKFIDAVEAAYALLSEHPASGSTHHAYLFPELPLPLRFHPVKAFPRILIYYLDQPQAVEVIRVWDAARGLDALLDAASD
ncbi:MAG: type II toxin-antitoxin system RelE/ParE family toxin [Nitrosospira sp.]|nr:type II toxin-antitoxin system RelE/ParE family toxin [Nitrosospira sp.]